jgi:hypothetical protein
MIMIDKQQHMPHATTTIMSIMMHVPCVPHDHDS